MTEIINKNSFDILLSEAFERPKIFQEHINDLLKGTIDKFNNNKVLKNLFSLLDLTTLHDDDYKNAIEETIKQTICNIDGEKRVVAGVCVYSNLLPILNSFKFDKNISKVVVSGGFPTAQLSLEAKLIDVNFAINNGANEIDVPINRGLFRENKSELEHEIKSISEKIHVKPNIKFKVIIESGELNNYKEVYEVSMIAMRNGADFIKTSTGKTSHGADIYSAAVMMIAMRNYLSEYTDRIVGFKAAGGIRTANEALQYYALFTYFFNENNINKDTFRIGCSNLINDIIKRLNILNN